jgi:hypothetical protein
MRRHRDSDLTDLVRHTIIWIAVVLWLAWSYAMQAPSGGPYTDGVRNAFTLVLAVVVPLISLVFLVAWVGQLRSRNER